MLENDFFISTQYQKFEFSSLSNKAYIVGYQAVTQLGGLVPVL